MPAIGWVATRPVAQNGCDHVTTLVTQTLIVTAPAGRFRPLRLQQQPVHLIGTFVSKSAGEGTRSWIVVVARFRRHYRDPSQLD
jgi:hypothetical protein